MTTEEIDKAANEFAEKHGFRVPYDGSNEFYDKVDVRASKDGFKAGVEFTDKHWQEKTRWIPVEERLPQIQANGFSDMVLTRDKHGIIKIERYDQEFGNFSGLRYGGEVTHWKEI